MWIAIRGGAECETQGEVISKILRHLKLAADPPPIAPARWHQAPFDWVPSTHGVTRGLVGAVRAAAGSGTSVRLDIPCAIVPPPGLPQPVVPRPSHRATPEPHPASLLSRRSRLLHNPATPYCAPLLRAADRGLRTLPSPRARSSCRPRVARGAGRKGRLFFLSILSVCTIRAARTPGRTCRHCWNNARRNGTNR